jgi:hypothetical protein
MSSFGGLSAVPLSDGTLLPYNSRSVSLHCFVWASCELKCALQLHLLQLSVYLVGVASCSLTSKTIYLIKQLVRSCVSVIGVGMVWLRIWT